MTLVVPEITDEEIDILEKNDFDWTPDKLLCRDIVLEGTKRYINKVLSALGRKEI